MDNWTDKNEVTVAKYRLYCAATNRAMLSPPAEGWIDIHPMVSVTWQDVKDCFGWAGVSLPTEAQWEKAAPEALMGVSIRAATCGKILDANWISSHGGTQAVGSYPSGISPYGCLDMAGNVWEWCNDWYDSDYNHLTGPSRNPLGPTSGTDRVLRGGA